MQQLYKKPIGDVLVSRDIISREQLEQALVEQKKTLRKLGEVLISLGMATEEQITESRSIQLDVPYINLQEEQIDPQITNLISEDVARTFGLIAVKSIGDKLIVAMVDPLDVEAIDLVQFGTKCRVEAALATEWRIMETINCQYGNRCTEDLQQSMEQASSNVEVTNISSKDVSTDLDEMKRQGHRAPVVRLVNLLLTQAVRKKASDIHIEPRRNKVDVRFRIDGELHLVKSLPRNLHAAVASRVKIMSEIDIAERRLPQDGRIALQIDGKTVDLRVSTSPSLHGERIVLRVLDRATGLMPLDDLGFTGQNLQLFQSMIKQPYGIVLVTGPTGSGKTTTLYASLNMLKSEHTNIMTVEDPIEYELEGINQTNVHHKIGLTFATQLRCILRQDPDIVLVGEIRDSETADVAFRAALTGHLVLSTLHCNDAASAITRLVDMDLEPFLVGSAVIGVTAQRLVKVLCPDCREPYQPESTERMLLGLEVDEPATVYKPVGCGNCGGTGYRGRTTVCEIMIMNDDIRRLVFTKASSTDIHRAAVQAGMTTMRDDCAQKVLAGITSLSEFQKKIFVESEILDPDYDVKVA